jgi:hypothetical protein
MDNDTNSRYAGYRNVSTAGGYKTHLVNPHTGRTLCGRQVWMDVTTVDLCKQCQKIADTNHSNRARTAYHARAAETQDAVHSQTAADTHTEYDVTIYYTYRGELYVFRKAVRADSARDAQIIARRIFWDKQMPQCQIQRAEARPVTVRH